MEYKLVRSVTADKFEQLLNEAAAEGWRLAKFDVRERQMLAVMERLTEGEEIAKEIQSRLG